MEKYKGHDWNKEEAHNNSFILLMYVEGGSNEKGNEIGEHRNGQITCKITCDFTLIAKWCAGDMWP